MRAGSPLEAQISVVVGGGGDDFIIITETQKAQRICQSIVRCFARLAKKFYTVDDNKRGYILAKNRDGVKKKFALVSVSLAIVDCFENMTLNQISQLAAGTKKLAKSKPGNSFAQNRRTQT